MIAILAAGGCGPRSRAAPRLGTLEIDVDATWSAIRDAQADRLAALASFSSAGDATIRFTDEEGGRRSEQVDLRLWRIAPDRAAVRLSKVGKSFLLAGWNNDRWWLLDEAGETPVLQVRRLGGDDAEGAAALLCPPTLLAMLGLLPWPETPPDSLRAHGPQPDGEPDVFRFELDHLDWPTADGGVRRLPGRLLVEIRRGLDGPARVELRNDAGETMAVSELERPEPVETRGLAPGGWPNLAHRMRVTRWNGDEVVVRLDRPLAGGEVSSRLFDLEAVRRRVPEAIVDEADPRDPEGAS